MLLWNGAYIIKNGLQWDKLMATGLIKTHRHIKAEGHGGTYFHDLLHILNYFNPQVSVPNAYWLTGLEGHFAQPPPPPDFFFLKKKL